MLAGWVATTRAARSAPGPPREHRWVCASPLTSFEPVSALRLDVSPEPTTGGGFGLVVTEVLLSTLCASVGDAVVSLTDIRHLPVAPGIYPDGHVHVLGLGTKYSGRTRVRCKKLVTGVATEVSE